MSYCTVEEIKAEITTDKSDAQIQALIDEKSEFINEICNTTWLAAPLPIKRACIILVCKEIDNNYYGEEAMVTDQKVGDFHIKKKITELTYADSITGIAYVDTVFKIYKVVDIEFRGI